MLKNLYADAEDVRDARLIPGLGRSSEGKPGNFMLQYSCLENPMDRGAWQPTVYRVAISCKGPTQALGCGRGFLSISLYKTLTDRSVKRERV